MKKNKYIFLESSKIHDSNNQVDYKVIVVLKCLDSYVLLNNCGIYDYIRFKVNVLDNETISNSVKEVIGIEVLVKYRGVLQDVLSGEKHCLFWASIDSQKLPLIKEYVEINTFTLSKLDGISKNNDIYEIAYYTEEEKRIEGFIVFVLIPLAILIALGVFIYNLINGKVIFELLVCFIGLFVIILVGIINYIKK